MKLAQQAIVFLTSSFFSEFCCEKIKNLRLLGVYLSQVTVCFSGEHSRARSFSYQSLVPQNSTRFLSAVLFFEESQILKIDLIFACRI